MIRLACPGCDATFTVPDTHAGKTAKCPKCETQFLIPEATDAPVQVLPKKPQVEDESIEVKPCPSCAARMAVGRGDVGSLVECPFCMKQFLAEPVEPMPPIPKPARRTFSRRDDDEAPRRRRSLRREEDDEDDDDDRPRRRRTRRSRRDTRPGGISTVGGLMLGGGIYGLIYVIGCGAGSVGFCCFWPGLWLQLVWSVLAIVRGAAMLNQDDRQGPPNTLVILQIISIVNFDIINMILGIVALVNLNDDRVKEYYAQRTGDFE
jgi:ribosomal protein L37AE/L43A